MTGYSDLVMLPPGKNATPELVAEQIADFLNSETRVAEAGAQWKTVNRDG